MQMVAPRRKKIAGKWYNFEEGFASRGGAETAAARLRSIGFSARIVVIRGIRGYFLYGRAKPLVADHKLWRG